MVRATRVPANGPSIMKRLALHSDAAQYFQVIKEDFVLNLVKRGYDRNEVLRFVDRGIPSADIELV